MVPTIELNYSKKTLNAFFSKSRFSNLEDVFLKIY